MTLYAAPELTAKGFLATKRFLALLSVILVAVSIFLWKSQEVRALTQLHSNTEAKARAYARETEIEYQKIINTLEKFASEGLPADETGALTWQKNAVFYIEIFDGIAGIAWVDPAFRIQYIEPQQAYASFLNLPVNDIEWAQSTSNLWVASNPEGAFRGYILGIVNIPGVISPVISEMNNDYMLQLSKEGVVVYSSDNWQQTQDGFMTSRTITLRDTDVLSLSLAPTDVLIYRELAGVRNTLFFSLIFSAIAIIAVLFAQNYNSIAQGYELRYRNLFEASKDAIFIINLDGKFLDANQAATTMVGYSMAELQKITVDDLLIPVDSTLRIQRAQIWRGGGAIELHMLHKEGFEIPADMMFSPIGQGTDLNLFSGIARDITERKKAEEELRDSKMMIEKIINSVPARIFWKDKNLVYLGCNEIFARDAGFTNPQELIGKDDYQMGWKDQAELYRRDDQIVIESGRPKLSIEESQTTPDGNTITLLTSKIPMRDSQDEITGVLGTYIDITERKQAEEEIRKLNENMEAVSLSAPQHSSNEPQPWKNLTKS